MQESIIDDPSNVFFSNIGINYAGVIFVRVEGCTAYNLCVKVTCESLYKTFCLTLSAFQLCSTFVTDRRSSYRNQPKKQIIFRTFP